MEEALKRGIEELMRRLQEIWERVDKRGAPTINEAKEIRRLFMEWQAKEAILQGIPEEEAYRQAERITMSLLGESMCILVKDR